MSESVSVGPDEPRRVRSLVLVDALLYEARLDFGLAVARGIANFRDVFVPVEHEPKATVRLDPASIDHNRMAPPEYDDLANRLHWVGHEPSLRVLPGTRRSRVIPEHWPTRPALFAEPAASGPALTRGTTSAMGNRSFGLSIVVVPPR